MCWSLKQSVACCLWLGLARRMLWTAVEGSLGLGLGLEGGKVRQFFRKFEILGAGRVE